MTRLIYSPRNAYHFEQKRFLLSFATRLGLIAVGVVAALSLGAPPESSAADQFVGGWAIRFSADVQPGFDPAAKKFARQPIKNDQGTVFSEYSLSFSSDDMFVVDKDGKVSFEHSDATFDHAAKWKATDGKTGDYQFTGDGTLRGSGQFDAQGLKLQLEWTSGAGQGVASGKPIREAAAVHSAKADWMLKPTKVRVSFGSADWQDVPGYTGTVRTAMPQQLAGCPPLPLVQRVEIYKLPTADLEVKAVQSPKPGTLGGRSTLKVTVKNLGPESSHGNELKILLPDGVKIVAPKEHEGDVPGIGPVLFPLNDLAKGAETEIELVYDDIALRPADAKEADSITLLLVSTAAHDPNPANNGHFERTQLQRK